MDRTICFQNPFRFILKSSGIKNVYSINESLIQGHLIKYLLIFFDTRKTLFSFMISITITISFESQNNLTRRSNELGNCYKSGYCEISLLHKECFNEISAVWWINSLSATKTIFSANA